MAILRKIAINGFKSIRQAEIELGSVNVLIGANGAGKTNILSFFKLLWAISEKDLARFVGVSGGASSLLHYGAKNTSHLQATLEFADVLHVMESLGLAAKPRRHAAYRIRLMASDADTLFFDDEAVALCDNPSQLGSHYHSLGRGHPESRLQDAARGGDMDAGAAWGCLRGLRTFHFHDTSSTAAIRRTADVNDLVYLRSDAGNLCAFLRGLAEAEDPIRRVAYGRIVETIRQIAPWFGDFVLEPSPLNPETIRLSFREKGSQLVFGPHVLPDGALRAMALVATLLQPESMLPPVLVIDEPELGLHPYAINILGALVKGAGYHCQVILATQSVPLLEQFDPEDVVVVEREDGASTFKRLRSEDLQDWLEDYSLGELWQKNVIGGGPA
jgi:predicted ATPase